MFILEIIKKVLFKLIKAPKNKCLTLIFLLLPIIIFAYEVENDTLPPQENNEYAIYEDLEHINNALNGAIQQKKQNKIAPLLYHKADYYYYQYNKDSALHYYNKALTLAKDIPFDSLLGASYYSIGHIYYELDDYDTAMFFAEKASKIFESLADSSMLIKVKELKAEIYNYEGKNQKAINVCIEIIKFYETHEDLQTKSELVNVYNIIGNVFINLGAFDKAKKYLTHAVELSRKFNNKYDLSVSYASIGNLYYEQKNYSRAKDIFETSFELDIELQDSMGIGFNLFSLGKTHLAMDSFKLALSYLNRGLKVAKRIEDKDLECNILAHMGNCLVNIGKYKEAIEKLDLAENIAIEIGALPILEMVYNHFSKYYESTGEVDKAFQYLKKYNRVSSQIHQQEDARKIAEIESVYELTEKEKEIELLRKEKKIQELLAENRKIIIIELLAIASLIFIISIVLYSRNRFKTRSNKILEKQKEELNDQKRKIEKQKNEIQNKSVKLSEINHQLTASIEYAKKIQTSLFADVQELKIIFPQSFVFNRPKDIISGDFYWINAEGDKAYLAVVDCTGHGVPGAFMTILANSLLNQIILEIKVASPEIILSLLDTKLKQNLLHHSEYLSSNGMDIAICIIDKSTYQVEFSGAHIAFYYANSNGLQQIKGTRFPIGSAYYENKKYTRQHLQLQAGDMIYLASDGFPDQFGGKDDKKFLRINFKKLLEKISVLKVPSQLKILEEAFNEWQGEQPQTDDILVVGIKL